MKTIAILNSIVFVILGFIHLYWVAGGSWGIPSAVPSNEQGKKLFNPSKTGTIIVALGLFLFATVNLSFGGIVALPISNTYLLYALLLVVILFAFRSIGDFKYVGFSKRFKQSEFARMDDALFSLLCALLALSHFYLYFS